MDPEPRWVTPSELAEYAYCPRASFYRRQSPDAPASPEAVAGSAYHARVLGRTRRAEAHPRVLWIGLALGAVLVLSGVLLVVRT